MNATKSLSVESAEARPKIIVSLASALVLFSVWELTLTASGIFYERVFELPNAFSTMAPALKPELLY